MTDEHKMGIVALDFQSVTSVRLLCGTGNDQNTVLGLSFFDANDDCIVSSFFRQQMKIEYLSIHTAVTLRQTQLGAVLSPDLAFLSTFQAHQGASSQNPCNYCLIKLSNMKRAFDPRIPDHELRTVQSTRVDYETYQTMFENVPKKQQTKALRASVTQNHSHSIVGKLMADFPFDCMLKALLHVRLGVSRSLLDWVFDFHLKIEEMYTGESHMLSRSIQEQLDRLIAFDTWLDEELSDFTTSLTGYERQMEALMDRLNGIQNVLDIPRISQPTRNTWQDSLAKVEQDIEKLKEDKHSEDELDYATQLAEVKRIANENIKHLRTLLAKHEGHSRRVIVDVLKKNTVDIQVYFNGVMNGAHCLNFAKNSDAIISGITTEMLELVCDDEKLCTAVRNFDVKMKRVLEPWCRLMCVMTSIKRHSADTIATFKDDIAEMKTAMMDLVVVSPPLQGEDNPLKLMTTLKSHIMFGKHSNDASISHALQQMIDFEATGSFDEQNGETTHADVNQLIRQFGNLRGMHAKKMWLREFHWRGHSTIRGIM